MVKKQSSNKYQRDCWSDALAPGAGAAAPESPTEACVAPPYYTPLTNRLSKYSLNLSCTINIDINSTH